MTDKPEPTAEHIDAGSGVRFTLNDVLDVISAGAHVMTPQKGDTAYSTRTGIAHYHTDCLSCGAMPPGSDRGSAHRSWAVRHVQKHPTHEVHVTLERVLRVTGARWT